MLKAGIQKDLTVSCDDPALENQREICGSERIVGRGKG